MLLSGRRSPSWLRFAAALQTGCGWLGLAIALCVVGCEPGTDLQYHGRVRVAEGDYNVLSLHSDAQDAYAFVRDRSKNDDLVILPFHAKPCRIGKAAAFAVLQHERGLRIAVLDANGPAANLHVLDERCASQLEPIAGVIDLGFVDNHLLVTDDHGALYAVEPWEGRLSTVSSGYNQRGSVVSAPGSPTALWLLEHGTLVLRDLDGHERKHTGRNVQEIAVARDQQSMIFSDDRGLYVLGGAGGDPQRLGDPGCTLRYEPWPSPKAVPNVAMALSPCKRGRLTFFQPEDKPRVLADGVISYFPRHFLDDDGVVENWTFYVTQADESSARRHFMAPPEGEGDAIELDVPISGHSTLYPFHLTRGVARFWLVTTAEAEPRLGLFTVGRGFVEVARQTQAVAASPAGFVVLHDYVKGAGGTLSLFDLEGRLRTLTHGVPAGGLLKWGPAKDVGDFAGISGLASVDAVLHDFDAASATGTLARIEGNGQLRETARGVPASSPDSYVTWVRGGQLVQAARDVIVLTYLHDFDAETKTGTLSLIGPDGREVRIDEDVASYVPSGDPNQEGVLYATSGSGAHEVWFVHQ